MDLIFDNPELPLERNWSGWVARAVMETEEGKRLYRRRVAELGKRVYGTGELTSRINALANLLHDSVAENDRARRKQFDASIFELQAVVKRRTDFILGSLKTLNVE